MIHGNIAKANCESKNRGVWPRAVAAAVSLPSSVAGAIAKADTLEGVRRRVVSRISVRAAERDGTGLQLPVATRGAAIVRAPMKGLGLKDFRPEGSIAARPHLEPCRARAAGKTALSRCGRASTGPATLARAVELAGSGRSVGARRVRCDWRRRRRELCVIVCELAAGPGRQRNASEQDCGINSESALCVRGLCACVCVCA